MLDIKTNKVVRKASLQCCAVLEKIATVSSGMETLPTDKVTKTNKSNFGFKT